MFSYITTESGFTHQIRTDCRRSSTENGQTAAEKPQLETAARESVFPRFATLHSEKQIRYCVYFRFRGFFDCTYLDISSTPKLQLPTATKLTCNCKFHPRKLTVSLQYTFSFSEKHQSCVCTTITLSHRFKAFSPAFCGQNRFRHEPPENFAKLLPAVL